MHIYARPGAIVNYLIFKIGVDKSILIVYNKNVIRKENKNDNTELFL